ncbi:MAG TPA: ABC transporter substrate-binding protein [Candidatus Monoglobus merdigallinarum]|uniref:ABC transporter substrate-binding protein n=1 Tax=Candidatus Monoglobus merdigallinarum TaxID=2838698 RepID=A0A9D1PQD8_9FIRM|nr:ABC transporter substrate-binding protein [Candidatus Monoglobus merdigallinarum]
MKSKKIMLLIAAMLCAGLLAGCASSESGTDSGSGAYKIGVLQYADHPSLDNCLEGFKQGLDSEGIEYELTAQSAKNDDATNTQIAQQFASRQLNLVCGIATPSAQACYNACYEAGIPVIFNAVSDPVAANLAVSDTEPMDGMTGVSDKLPVEEQLKLIREILPEAQKIGILYTTSEANSVSTIEEYKEKAGAYGFEIVERGITNAAEIPQAIDVLLPGVDCVTNMTDNTIVNNLPVLIEKAEAAGVPVFGSEEEQVAAGCVASAGIDYIELGRKAGVMAARILSGEDISGIPYETMTESKITINPDAAAAFNVELPQSVTDRAEVRTSQADES